jgi:hypothetical protein
MYVIRLMVILIVHSLDDLLKNHKFILRNFIQDVLWGTDIAPEDDFLGPCDQNDSYKHG